MFLNNIGVVYRDCLFKFDTSKDDFTALQLALPSFIDELNNFEKKTKLNEATITGLQDVDPPENLLDKSGYLWKRGEGFGKVFHKRYITIKKNKFTYYKDAKTNIEERNSMDLLTASVKPITNVGRPNCFQLIGPTKTWIFEALSIKDLQEWIKVIQNNIIYSFDHQESNEEHTETKGSEVCADCGAANPTWCCINWGTKICIHCSGVHRSFGTNVSMVRSLTLDHLEKFNTELIAKIGNMRANQILLARSEEFPGEVPKGKWTDSANRHTILASKYINLKYTQKLREGENIFDYIKAGNFDGVLRCVFAGVLRDVQPNTFSPLHLAAAYGDQNITLLIAYNSKDMDALDEGGWSPMSYAAYYNRSDVCSMLMKIGSNPLSSTKGFPYHIAVQNGKLDIAALYLPYWKGDATVPGYSPPVKVFPEEEKKEDD